MAIDPKDLPRRIVLRDKKTDSRTNLYFGTYSNAVEIYCIYDGGNYEVTIPLADGLYDKSTPPTKLKRIENIGTWVTSIICLAIGIIGTLILIEGCK